jgi:hypothetical protein
MPSLLELLQQGQDAQLWERCCGFYDLSLDQFMKLQEQILLEQIELLPYSELGRKLLCGERPKTVAEFREQIPLTTYRDYVPYLPEKLESALPSRPVNWQRTSGRFDEFAFKWVPISQRMHDALGDLFVGLSLTGSGGRRGVVAIQPGDKLLYGLAPPPYASGAWTRRIDEEGIFEILPSLNIAEQMEFHDRIEHGFQIALADGLDAVAAVGSVLVAIGNRLSERGGSNRFRALLKNPKSLPRLTYAVLKSKLQGRPLLPRDIWKLKFIVCFGTDAFVYREKIKEQWGKYPLDLYASTECQIIAIQSWNYKDLTFLPYINFWEFLPVPEYARWKQDPQYSPRTVLLDEVIPGTKYVMIGTNCLGGSFTRYVIGDVIEITALRDPEAGINLPQMAFYGRADGILDFETASHVAFTEKMIWMGIADTNIPYKDWIARKELEDGVPVLHLYIELKGGSTAGEKDLKENIHEHFKKASADYDQITTIYGVDLLRVSTIPAGSFDRYAVKRIASGADQAHLKPPHMNPPDSTMKMLLGEGFNIARSISEIRDEELEKKRQEIRADIRQT